MGNSFRNQPAPALYPDDKTPFAADVLEVGLAVACGMIAFSFLLILPGIRGWEVRNLLYDRQFNALLCSVYGRQFEC